MLLLYQMLFQLLLKTLAHVILDQAGNDNRGFIHGAFAIDSADRVGETMVTDHVVDDALGLGHLLIGGVGVSHCLYVYVRDKREKRPYCSVVVLDANSALFK